MSNGKTPENIEVFSAALWMSDAHRGRTGKSTGARRRAASGARCSGAIGNYMSFYAHGRRLWPQAGASGALAWAFTDGAAGLITARKTETGNGCTGRGFGGTVGKGLRDGARAFAPGQAADDGGAQLCVSATAKKVVDLWTGRDRERDRPYTDKTLTVMMSCSKGAVATSAHMLAERGLLELRCAGDAVLAGVRPGGERRRAGIRPAVASRRTVGLRTGQRHRPARPARLEQMHRGAAPRWRRCGSRAAPTCITR